MPSKEISDRVLRFISANIRTVPELETLLLLWRDPQRSWSSDEVSARLRLSNDEATTILHTLERRHLARASDDQTPLPRFQFETARDSTGGLLAELSVAYAYCLGEITTLIHSRASPSPHELAPAFDAKRRG